MTLPFRCPPLSAPVRSAVFFSAPDGCNIAPGKDPAMETASGNSENFGQRFSAAAFCCRQTTASCTFVRQRYSSLCEAGRSPESNAFLTDIMNTDRKRTLHPPTPSYKYSFRLNEDQNICFNEMLCKAGLEHNRSRFIVKRIFSERFVVIRRAPSKVQFVARLNDFYFQFQPIGNIFDAVVSSFPTIGPFTFWSMRRTTNSSKFPYPIIVSDKLISDKGNFTETYA